MTARIAGNCLCGAVTIEATPVGEHLTACHCGMCRAWAAGVFLSVHVRDVDAKGPIRTRQTSDWAERGWCDECGSVIWYRLTGDGPYAGMYGLSAGLFPDGANQPLGLEYYIDLKPKGWSFTGNHTRMTDAEVQAYFAAPPEGDMT